MGASNNHHVTAEAKRYAHDHGVKHTEAVRAVKAKDPDFADIEAIIFRPATITAQERLLQSAHARSSRHGYHLADDPSVGEWPTPVRFLSTTTEKWGSVSDVGWRGPFLHEDDEKPPLYATIYLYLTGMVGYQHGERFCRLARSMGWQLRIFSAAGEPRFYAPFAQVVTSL